jgi:hypothetical protein
LFLPDKARGKGNTETVKVEDRKVSYTHTRWRGGRGYPSTGKWIPKHREEDRRRRGLRGEVKGE